MRLILTLAALALGLAAPAARADELTLRADAMVVDVQINGKPARLLVDALLPDVAVIDPEAATRLGVNPVPMVKATVMSDDVSISGRIARPRIVFANGKASRSLTALFGQSYDAGSGLDGAIGPGVLPYDRVRVVLKDGPGGLQNRTFALSDPEVWSVATPLGSAAGRMNFDLKRRDTVLSRNATDYLSANGHLTPAGELVGASYPLGLSTQAQPVSVDVRMAGFAFGPTLARTRAPLTPPDGMEVTVVAQAKEKRIYTVTLGRAAISDCTDMVWVRRAKTLTLKCG